LRSSASFDVRIGVRPPFNIIDRLSV